MAEGDPLLRSFQFRVTLKKSPDVESGFQSLGGRRGAGETSDLGDGGFQECTGLEVEMDIQEYNEGGRNDGVIRRAGRAKYQNIVLKRGMFYKKENGANRDLWQWIQGVVAGERPIARYDGTIQVMSVANEVAATWIFDRALPAKISGPQLNAKTGEVAIEELHIAHEGLRLVEN